MREDKYFRDLELAAAFQTQSSYCLQEIQHSLGEGPSATDQDRAAFRDGIQLILKTLREDPEYNRDGENQTLRSQVAGLMDQMKSCDPDALREIGSTLDNLAGTR